MKKCKYTRDTDIEVYTPECCMDDDYPSQSVHEEDMYDWTYCPFCSHKIRAYTDGAEDPDWGDGDDDELKGHSSNCGLRLPSYSNSTRRGECDCGYGDHDE